MSDDDYDVGYGKPPKSGQFKKGKSGNPKGRPPKSARLCFQEDLHQIIMDEAREVLVINGKNGEEFLSAIQATIRQLKIQGLKGDRLSAKEFFKMVQQASLGEKASFEELMQTIIDVSKNLQCLDDDEFQQKTGTDKATTMVMLEKLFEHKKNRFPDT